MEGQQHRPDSGIDAILHRLAELEERISALEGRAVQAEESSSPAEAGAASFTDGSAQDRSSGTSALTLIGQTLLVLGGAFLLRAVTEEGLIPDAAGTALGIGYALFWIVMADRAARTRRWRHASLPGYPGGNKASGSRGSLAIARPHALRSSRIHSCSRLASASFSTRRRG